MNEPIRNTDLTRNTLLQAAYCEIHRHGFQGASIASILESTRLTKGALYHHFPTKQALGLAVIDDVIAPAIDQLILQPVRDSANPVGALLDTLHGLPERIGENNLLLGCPLNNLMQEMSPLDEDFRHRLEQILQHWRDVLETAFRTGQQQGVIRDDVDCQAAALFVQSAWEGCMGVTKTMQSLPAFASCVGQLCGYVRSLMISPTHDRM